VVLESPFISPVAPTAAGLIFVGDSLFLMFLGKGNKSLPVRKKEGTGLNQRDVVQSQWNRFFVRFDMGTPAEFRNFAKSTNLSRLK